MSKFVKALLEEIDSTPKKNLKKRHKGSKRHLSAVETSQFYAERGSWVDTAMVVYDYAPKRVPHYIQGREATQHALEEYYYHGVQIVPAYAFYGIYNFSCYNQKRVTL